MTINPDRVNLAEAIPLTGPLSVNVEMSSRCNFACSFCPTALPEEWKRVGFEKRDMDDDLFRKIVDDFKQMPRVKVFNLHMMGESQLHPHFYDLAVYATTSGIADRYEMRTNGSLLTEGRAQKLVDAGLTRIGISVEAVTNEGYQKLVRAKPGMLDRVIEGVKNLYVASRGRCRTYAKIVDFRIPETDTERFKELFAPIVDEVAIEYPEQWNSGLKTDTTLGQGVTLSVNGDPLQDHTACPFSFFTLAINVTGKTVICCFDWSYQNVIGIAGEQSIKEIWNSPNMFAHWRMQLEGRRKESAACRDCTNIQTSPDGVDDHREKLLERISSVGSRTTLGLHETAAPNENLVQIR